MLTFDENVKNIDIEHAVENEQALYSLKNERKLKSGAGDNKIVSLNVENKAVQHSVDSFASFSQQYDYKKDRERQISGAPCSGTHTREENAQEDKIDTEPIPKEIDVTHESQLHTEKESSYRCSLQNAQKVPLPDSVAMKPRKPSEDFEKRETNDAHNLSYQMVSQEDTQHSMIPSEKSMNEKEVLESDVQPDYYQEDMRTPKQTPLIIVDDTVDDIIDEQNVFQRKGKEHLATLEITSHMDNLENKNGIGEELPSQTIPYEDTQFITRVSIGHGMEVMLANSDQQNKQQEEKGNQLSSAAVAMKDTPDERELEHVPAPVESSSEELQQKRSKEGLHPCHEDKEGGELQHSCADSVCSEIQVMESNKIHLLESSDHHKESNPPLLQQHSVQKAGSNEAEKTEVDLEGREVQFQAHRKEIFIEELDSKQSQILQKHPVKDEMVPLIFVQQNEPQERQKEMAKTSPKNSRINRNEDETNSSDDIDSNDGNVRSQKEILTCTSVSDEFTENNTEEKAETKIDHDFPCETMGNINVQEKSSMEEIPEGSTEQHDSKNDRVTAIHSITDGGSNAQGSGELKRISSVSMTYKSRRFKMRSKLEDLGSERSNDSHPQPQAKVESKSSSKPVVNTSRTLLSKSDQQHGEDKGQALASVHPVADGRTTAKDMGEHVDKISDLTYRCKRQSIKSARMDMESRTRSKRNQLSQLSYQQTMENINTLNSDSESISSEEQNQKWSNIVLSTSDLQEIPQEVQKVHFLHASDKNTEGSEENMEQRIEDQEQQKRNVVTTTENVLKTNEVNGQVLSHHAMASEEMGKYEEQSNSLVQQNTKKDDAVSSRCDPQHNFKVQKGPTSMIVHFLPDSNKTDGEDKIYEEKKFKTEEKQDSKGISSSFAIKMKTQKRESLDKLKDKASSYDSDKELGVESSSLSQVPAYRPLTEVNSCRVKSNMFKKLMRYIQPQKQGDISSRSLFSRKILHHHLEVQSEHILRKRKEIPELQSGSKSYEELSNVQEFNKTTNTVSMNANDRSDGTLVKSISVCARPVGITDQSSPYSSKQTDNTSNSILTYTDDFESELSTPHEQEESAEDTHESLSEMSELDYSQKNCNCSCP